MTTIELLRLNGEAQIAFANRKPIQVRAYDRWFDSDSPIWNFAINQYRPKPEPKVRGWNCPEDVPGPICWITAYDGTPCTLVVGITEAGIVCHQTETLVGSYSWSDIQKFKHSTDRKTWKPCVTEEP